MVKDRKGTERYGVRKRHEIYLHHIWSYPVTQSPCNDFILQRPKYSVETNVWVTMGGGMYILTPSGVGVVNYSAIIGLVNVS